MLQAKSKEVFQALQLLYASMIRDQFQSFGIDGMNYSVCFSLSPIILLVRNFSPSKMRLGKLA